MMNILMVVAAWSTTTTAASANELDASDDRILLWLANHNGGYSTANRGDTAAVDAGPPSTAILCAADRPFCFDTDWCTDRHVSRLARRFCSQHAECVRAHGRCVNRRCVQFRLCSRYDGDTADSRRM